MKKNHINKALFSALIVTLTFFCKEATSQSIAEKYTQNSIGQSVIKEWEGLVPGGRFRDLFLPSPVRHQMTSDTWGGDNVKPRDILNSIEHPDWEYWGGHIKQVGDTYNFYACRWPEHTTHNGWWDAEVVVAKGKDPMGPFTFEKRIGSGYNPEIYPIKGGQYALYIHHPKFFNDRTPKKGEMATGTWYVAPSLEGPWEANVFKFDPRGRRVIEGLSNMSFTTREDSSILAVCRGGGIWINKTGMDTWEQVTNKRVYPEWEGFRGAYEDPVIWKTDVQYHMIVNDYFYKVAYYLRSKDGIEWKAQPGEAYTPGIDVYEDGTNVDWFKYERIRFDQDEYGRPTTAYFAVIDCPKAEDLANDIHSGKNIAIPMTVGRRLTVLNKEAIGADTKEIQVKVMADPGFNPHKDMDIKSLRYGAAEEVDYGRGCKVIKTKKDGKDLILIFDGKGNGFEDHNFAGKMLGKTKKGKLLFGYSRLPGVEYTVPVISPEIKHIDISDSNVKMELDVKNFGLVPSKESQVDIVLDYKGNKTTLASKTISALQSYEEVSLNMEASIEQELEGIYHIELVVDGGDRRYEVMRLKQVAGALKITEDMVSMSSVYYGGVPYKVCDIDFNTPCHTREEDYPWVEINLGEVKDISKVVLSNRLDCCQERLSDFYLFVSDKPFKSKNIDETVNQPRVRSVYHKGKLPQGETTKTYNINCTGQYIRIQLNKKEILSIGEIMVFEN
jgi:hypothetical protein